MWLGALPISIAISAADVTAVQSLQGAIDPNDVLTPAATLRIYSDERDVNGSLQWSIGGGNNGPDVLSELTFDGLYYRTANLGMSIDVNRGKLAGTHWQINYQQGLSQEGDVQDSDYDGNNRSEEYSRSMSSAQGSELFGFSISGYKDGYIGDHFTLHPNIGLEWQRQSMLITNGEQVIETRGRTHSLGAIKNLDSSYTSDWLGGWIGLQSSWHRENHSVTLATQYHLYGYYAAANWNLRSDLAQSKSFEHFAMAHGFKFGLRYNWAFSESGNVYLDAHRESYVANDGTDVVYFANGNETETSLEEVNWHATSAKLGVKWNI